MAVQLNMSSLDMDEAIFEELHSNIMQEFFFQDAFGKIKRTRPSSESRQSKRFKPNSQSSKTAYLNPQNLDLQNLTFN